MCHCVSFIEDTPTVPHRIERRSYNSLRPMKWLWSSVNVGHVCCCLMGFWGMVLDQWAVVLDFFWVCFLSHWARTQWLGRCQRTLAVLIWFSTKRGLHISVVWVAFTWAQMECHTLSSVIPNQLSRHCPWISADLDFRLVLYSHKTHHYPQCTQWEDVFRPSIWCWSLCTSNWLCPKPSVVWSFGTPCEDVYKETTELSD